MSGRHIGTKHDLYVAIAELYPFLDTNDNRDLDIVLDCLWAEHDSPYQTVAHLIELSGLDQPGEILYIGAHS